MDKKHVLLVSGGVVIHGGLETFIMNWIVNSPQGAYDYSWYHPQISDYTEMEESFRKLGVKLYCGGLPSNPVRSHFILKHAIQSAHDIMITNSNLRRLMREQRFDIVHINTASILVTMVALWQAKRARIPVRVAHSHSAGGAGDGTSILKWLTYHFAYCVINRCVTRRAACSTKAAESLFGKAHKGEVIHVPNFIDARRFAFSAAVRERTREQLSLQGRFVIGQVARLSEEKNQKFMIDVFMEMHNLNSEARLLLVGDGPLREELQAYVNELGLGDVVLFAGSTDRPQDYYPALDLFMLPSLYEGLPIVGIEAQTSGLPCVFSDTVTSEADISGHCLFLSLSLPPEEWSRRIQAFLLDQQINREDAWARTVAAGYDISCIAETVSQLYVDHDNAQTDKVNSPMESVCGSC